MAIGLRLIITDTRLNTTQERLFGQFPVRIGRNPLNDLRLMQPFVSQFHAVLELQGNSLMLRDLGSKNGTLLSEGRAPAHQPADLAPAGGRFAISSLAFEARVEDVGVIAPVRAPQKGLLLGGAFAEKEEVMETLALDMDSPMALQALLKGVGKPPPPPLEGEAPPTPARPPELPKGANNVRPLVGQYQAARSVTTKVVQGLSAEASALTPEEREKLLGWAREAFPGLGDDPEFQRLAEYHGITVAKGDSANLARRLEYVALQAVRELATLYLPGVAPIGSEDDLVRFLTKTRDTLDMFFKCFIPLRDGYRQFKSDMDIRDVPSSYDSPAGRAQKAVERAHNPRALAALLLSFGDDSTASQKAVEGSFADLMIHQLALLSGVMRGVKGLVEELSPGSIEKVFEDRRKKGKTGMSWGPYRFRELWKVYMSKHSDLSDGEKQLYSLIFGADFARAYAQLSGEAAQAPTPAGEKS